MSGAQLATSLLVYVLSGSFAGCLSVKVCSLHLHLSLHCTAVSVCLCMKIEQERKNIQL